MNTSKLPVITIDGPAASGKGTIAEIVADRLGFVYLDSGALYRLATLAALNEKVDLDDPKHLEDVARQMKPEFKNGRIFLKGEDVTQAIRSDEVSAATSKVATVPGVRQALFDCQRSFAKEPGLVADGRDMGTVVFPEAKLKIYMTADVKVRAKRRFDQQVSRGLNVTYDDIEKDLIARDERDMSRATAPLKPATDAKVLDSTELTIEQVVKKVLDWWHQAQ